MRVVRLEAAIASDAAGGLIELPLLLSAQPRGDVDAGFPKKVALRFPPQFRHQPLDGSKLALASFPDGEVGNNSSNPERASFCCLCF